MTQHSTAPGMLVAGALAALVGVTFAQPTKPERAPVDDTEIRYQAGGSPLADVEMYQDINPKAPPMSKAEFDKEPYRFLNSDDAANVADTFARLVPERIFPTQYE